MCVRATGRDAALRQSDRGQRAPRHHHDRAARTQQGRDLLTHREHGIAFIETGRPRRARRGMTRIDGDREATQWIHCIDQRRTTDAQHELPTTLIPDRLPAEHRLRERERDAHTIARDLIPADAAHQRVVAENRRDLGVGLHPIQGQHQRATIRLHEVRRPIAGGDRHIDPFGTGRHAESAGHASRHRGAVGKHHEIIAVHPHIERPIKSDAREALGSSGYFYDRAVQQHPLVGAIHNRARVHYTVGVTPDRRGATQHR